MSSQFDIKPSESPIHIGQLIAQPESWREFFELLVHTLVHWYGEVAGYSITFLIVVSVVFIVFFLLPCSPFKKCLTKWGYKEKKKRK